MFKISTLSAAAILASVCLSGPAWALGSTPVTVVNPADIAKAEGIQQPYQAGQIACLLSDFDTTACTGSINAPQTQRLVLEFVSGFCGLQSGVAIRSATIATVVGGAQNVTHNLAVNPPPSNTFGQQVRIYADPASLIFVTVEYTGPNPGTSCIFSLSGQAITVP